MMPFRFVANLLTPLFVAAAFCGNAANSFPAAPPFTDYCDMLARDIQGRKTGFMAGNKMLYVGGQAGPEWQIRENETLGFTHGYFYDGRCRGRGIYPTAKTGRGHDFQGWEFYRETKIAYGTVIIDGKRFANPIPLQMIWRPDGMICKYDVAGVRIEEKKFIANNDVVCSIITASRPLELEFAGQSFVSEASVKTSSTASFDPERNAIHIVEGGTAWCEPEQGMTVEGRLMYDGLHTVVAASVNIAQSYSISTDKAGRQQYTFRIPCDTKGVAIAHAMGDDYPEVVSRVAKVLANPAAARQSKTERMNGLLNSQIPYFRCSDAAVVKTYYYLWSLYFMYFRDVPQGHTKYPYTVTAVNNFQSPFAFDHWAYVHEGAWVTNKHQWGFGNALIWKEMLPHVKNNSTSVPETMGIAWQSPLNAQNVNAHPEGAWKMYAHSGDRKFLATIYDFYRSL